MTSSTAKMRASVETAPRFLAAVRRFAATRKRTLDPVKLAHANAPLAADRCDLGYFYIAALCPTSTARRRQVKSGRTKRRRYYRWRPQTYCQILDLGRQINQAVREKDQKKAKALSQKLGQLGKQLPEFILLSNIIEQVDLNSANGREIALIIQSLNQSCPE